MNGSCCEKKDSLVTICQEYKDEIAHVMSFEGIQQEMCATNKEDIGSSIAESSHIQTQSNFQSIQNSDQSILVDGDVLHENKNLHLSGFSSTHEVGLNLESLGSTSSALPFDSHFYNNVNHPSIMVYEVPHGSIVPFESLVSAPLGRNTEKLNDLGIMPGPSHVMNRSEHHAAHTLYPLSESKFRRHDEKLLVGQIYPEDPGNIILEGNSEYDRNEKFEIGLTDTLASDFNMPIENVQYTVSSEINQMCLAGGYQTTNDTDSEVALTLASLGNPKAQSSDNDAIYNSFCEVQETHHIPPIESAHKKNETKTAKSSLCLRSRKVRGNTSLSVNESQHDKLESSVKKKRQNKTKCKSRNVTDHSHNMMSNDHQTPQNTNAENAETQASPPKENLLGQLLKASKHCEPASLIPEGVVDDVIPAVGYRIMDMCNLSEMIRMMHHCPGNQPAGIVIQEQASLRQGAVSQLSIICTGCQEGTICATSGRLSSSSWDINARVEQLTKEFNILEDQLCRMLEILGIFYRPTPPPPPEILTTIQLEKEALVQEKGESPKEKPKKKAKRPVKEKKIECTVCKEKFACVNHLKSHMRAHNGELHTCPYCYQYFKKSYNLREHIKKHENVKYECTICHKKYTDKSTLAKHTLSKHEEKYKIECEFCSKRFYHRTHYNEHQRMHTKEKPFSCEICGNRFSYHDSVKKHMKIHVATSRYKCRLCCKQFKWQLGLRHHLLMQHKLRKCDIDDHVSMCTTTEVNPVETAKPLPNEPDLDKFLDNSVIELSKSVNNIQECMSQTDTMPYKPDGQMSIRDDNKKLDNLNDCAQTSTSSLKPSSFLYQVTLDDEEMFY